MNTPLLGAPVSVQLRQPLMGSIGIEVSKKLDHHHHRGEVPTVPSVPTDRSAPEKWIFDLGDPEAEVHLSVSLLPIHFPIVQKESLGRRPSLGRDKSMKNKGAILRQFLRTDRLRLESTLLSEHSYHFRERSVHLREHSAHFREH